MAYSDLSVQKSMFFDSIRNDYYLTALKKWVTPDSVVLDLGSGLGLHGLMAASLGARKVYLVEPESLGKLGALFGKDNNLDERIEFIQGRIEDIRLPEKVDMITSVLTGNFLLNEDLLPSLYFARDHWLKPNGYLIPDGGRMYTVPVSCERLYKQHIRLWEAPYYGLDIRAARQFAVNQPYPIRNAETLDYLATPTMLQDISFTRDHQATCSAKQSFEPLKSAVCHGFIGWFDLHLGDTWHRLSPDSPQTHWSPLFYPFNEPIKLEKGNNLELSIDKPAGREWVWRSQYNGHVQNHSTLFAGPH